MVNIIASSNKLEVENFPLYLYIQDDFSENTPLTFPNDTNNPLEDDKHPTIIDDDVYDEFGFNMRHELASELDFNTSIEYVTRLGKISLVRHEAEWEYIRHPCQILQFHEVANNKRPEFGTSKGANNDMDYMRHKFEFRLNRDLGFEWVLWRDTNNTWQSVHLNTVGAKKEIIINANTAIEQRFLVFSISPNPNDPGTLA